MYKLKKIILCLILIGFVFSITACKKPDPDPEPDPDPDPIIKPEPSPLYPIGLDLSGMKQNFEKGDEYENTGLKAHARLSDYSTKDVTDKMVVDSKKYDSTKDGTYEIIVFYTEIVNDVSITVKSFYFAIVGTGQTGPDEGGDDKEKTFGPGTYSFKASTDLLTYEKSAVINTNTKFADGFFTV